VVKQLLTTTTAALSHCQEEVSVVTRDDPTA